MLGGWSIRLPSWVTRTLLATVIASPIAVEIASTGGPCSPQAPCRYMPGSAHYYVAGIFEATAISTVALVLLLPWFGAALAVLAQFVLLTQARFDLHHPRLWVAALVVVVIAVLADVALGWRQEVISHSWSGAAPADVRGERRRGVPRGRGAISSWDTRAAAGALLVVLTLAAVTSWTLQTRAVRNQLAFESRASHTVGRIDEVNEDDGTITFTYDGQRRHTLDVNDTNEYSPGVDVNLLVDPNKQGDVQLVNEPFDPTGWLYLAVLLTAAATCGSWWLWGVGVRRADVAAAIGPVVQVRVAATRRGLALTTVEDARFARPVAMVGRLIQVDVQGSPWQRDAEYLDPDRDADLVAWAEQAFDDDDGNEERPRDRSTTIFPPVRSQGVLVDVIGLRSDGKPVVITDPAGRRWLTGHGVRRPSRRSMQTFAGVRPLGWTAARDHQASFSVIPPGTGPLDGWPRSGSPRSTSDRWAAWAGTIGALLLAVIGYVVARLLFAGSIAELLHAGQAAVFLVAPTQLWLAGIGQPAVEAHPAGLVDRGLLFERVVPAIRVTTVLVGPDSVTVRLRDPADAITWRPSGFVRRFRPTAIPSALDAGRQLRNWVDAVPTDSPRRHYPPRPTAGTVSVALMIALVLTAWFGSR